MHEKNVLHSAPVEVVVVGEHLLRVGVRAQRIEHDDLRLETIFVPEYFNLRLALDDPPAERVRRAVADHQHHITIALDRVLQVVKDASRFRHTRRGDRHKRSLAVGEFLRVLDVRDVGESPKTERILVIDEEHRRLEIEALGVHPKDFGRVGRKGAIDDDREAGRQTFLEYRVDEQDYLLRAPDAEGGDDDLGAALVAAVERLRHFRLGDVRVVVLPAAVGAFADEVVDRRNCFGGRGESAYRICPSRR